MSQDTAIGILAGIAIGLACGMCFGAGAVILFPPADICEADQ